MCVIALFQYLGDGKNYFWQIMLPGSVVGLIVGYVTQVHGRSATVEGGNV